MLTGALGWLATNTDDRAVGGRLRYRIELLAVPVGVAHAADRTGVVQEGVRVADLHLARQGVRIVGRGVAVVVHIDVVEDTVIPLIVVRAALRSLQRNPAGQQDKPILVGRRQERIRVGVVGVRVFRDQGRLAMARGFGMAGKSDQYAADQECSCGGHTCREANSAFPSVFGLHTTFSFCTASRLGTDSKHGIAALLWMTACLLVLLSINSAAGPAGDALVQKPAR